MRRDSNQPGAQQQSAANQQRKQHHSNVRPGNGKSPQNQGLRWQHSPFVHQPSLKQPSFQKMAAVTQARHQAQVDKNKVIRREMRDKRLIDQQLTEHRKIEHQHSMSSGGEQQLNSQDRDKISKQLLHTQQVSLSAMESDSSHPMSLRKPRADTTPLVCLALYFLPAFEWRWMFMIKRRTDV